MDPPHKAPAEDNSTGAVEKTAEHSRCENHEASRSGGRGREDSRVRLVLKWLMRGLVTVGLHRIIDFFIN